MGIGTNNIAWANTSESNLVAKGGVLFHGQIDFSKPPQDSYIDGVGNLIVRSKVLDNVEWRERMCFHAIFTGAWGGAPTPLIRLFGVDEFDQVMMFGTYLTSQGPPPYLVATAAVNGEPVLLTRAFIEVSLAAPFTIEALTLRGYCYGAKGKE